MLQGYNILANIDIDKNTLKSKKTTVSPKQKPRRKKRSFKKNPRFRSIDNEAGPNHFTRNLHRSFEADLVNK